MATDMGFIKHTLHEIATQSYGLAMGLQNAAPAHAGPSKSTQYLLEISLQIEKVGKIVEEMAAAS